VFAGIGITGAAGIINFVVLTAAASSLNSAIFTTGRMLFSLSKGKGYAGKINKRYIPNNAINISVLLVALAVVLNFFFPANAFDLVTSIASAAFVVMYAVLVYAHVKYRKTDDFKKGKQLFKMPGAPVTDYLTIAFLIGIFLILLFTKDTMSTTVLAIVWFVIMIVISLRIKTKK
jgi:L-asparagine transporter-like permease